MSTPAVTGASFRVVRFLREHPAGRYSAAEIAEALGGASPRYVVSVLQAAEAEGMVRRFRNPGGPALWKVVR